jgi:DNA primase small subunit
MGRREIVDYVSGTGLAMFRKGRKDLPKQKKGAKVFSLNDYGWNRRLKNGMRKFILNATKDDLKEIGIKGRTEVILQNKDRILKECVEENRWSNVKGVGVETWLKIAEHMRTLESAQIDTVVTTDIHRLIRAEGTLHGKTGLLKVEFPVSQLDEFDVFKEAVAFKEGSAKVLVSDAPEFRLGGETFGPFKNKAVELPTAAAVLLICKGRADLVT